MKGTINRNYVGYYQVVNSHYEGYSEPSPPVQRSMLGRSRFSEFRKNVNRWTGQVRLAAIKRTHHLKHFSIENAFFGETPFLQISTSTDAQS